MDPLTVTSASIRCLRARGKSSGVRSVVQDELDTSGSDGSHCESASVRLVSGRAVATYDGLADGFSFRSRLVVIIFALQIPVGPLHISFIPLCTVIETSRI